MSIEFLSVPPPEIVVRKEMEGKYSEAREIIRRFLKRNIEENLRSRLIYEIERIDRLKKDYPYRRKDALSLLNSEIRDFSEDEFDAWIKEGVVDYIRYDDEYLFFDRFVDNLIFLKPSLRARRIKKDMNREKINSLLKKRIDAILRGERKKYRIHAGIRIKIRREIPQGERYRVWLPFPKLARGVDKIKIVSIKPSNYFLSGEEQEQRTIYFESSSKEYWVEFEYIIEERVGKENGEGNWYEDHLSEKLPHVRFTPYLKSLADNIIGDEEEPYLKAKKIYEWITRNIRYTYVREYGTYSNISEYAASNLRGDCGFHALLFITLSRIAGIPAKWQSGWFVTPYYSGPHDWSEIYVEPYGWIPVDLSFGNIRRRRGKYHEFYFGNLDAFRMIANDDFQVEFNPRKIHYRSDPVDNQRGEVEWSRDNIYYDEFEWNIYAKSIKAI